MENKGPIFKDKDIEDFLDIHFYHPLGYKFALFFSKLDLTPNMVSFMSMIFGVLGGMLIYHSMDISASIFIIFASVLDSSDGQLARMINRTSVYGRIIDGLVGYIMFASIYLAIFFRNPKISFLILMIIAGVSNAIHSSVYDFYRTAYLSVLRKKYSDFSPLQNGGFLSKIYDFYSSYQRFLCRYHIIFIKNLVENKKEIDDNKIPIYKKKMLSNIQFINLLGDNWKINGVLFLSIINRVDWFFYYIIFIMNAVFAFVIIRQRKIDLEIISEV